jgi:hypothetical protein
MNPKKSFKLSRGCAIGLVLASVVAIAIGACMVRLLQWPNDLGTGLGRAGRVINILLSAKAGDRQMLEVYQDRTVIHEFLDRPGVFRAEDVALSDDEWRVLSAAYQQWCTNPPQSVAWGAYGSYDIGISCSSDFGRHIQIQETQLSPEIRALFKRVTTQ